MADTVRSRLASVFTPWVRFSPRVWSAPASLQRLEVVWLALLMLWTAYLLGHLIAFGYGRDQGVYAVVANGMLRGAPPYRGTWDVKPPGIFLIYAVARWTLGPSVHAIRVLEAVSLASLIGAFAIFSRRHLDTARAGVLAGALAIFGHVQLDFWHTGQPESFASVTLAWALVMATYVPPEGARWPWLRQTAAWAITGALYAVASLLKPPLGGGLVVAWAVIVWNRHQANRAARWWLCARTPSVTLACGAAVPILCTVGYFVATDAWREWCDVLFRYTPHYVALGLGGRSPTELLAQTLHDWLIRFSVLNAFGLALLVAFPVLAARERQGTLHVLGVIGVSLLGVAMQAKFFSYHFGATLPLTALLAGWGFWKLWRFSPAGTGVLCAGCILWFLPNNLGLLVHGGDPMVWRRCMLRLTALADPAVRDDVNDLLYSAGDLVAKDNRQVAQWVIQHTAPNDSIYVWGVESVIYDMTNRRPATRFIYNVPQRAAWPEEESRRLLLTELEQAAPRAVVVAHGDALPRVTGNDLDSAAALPAFPALAAWLDTHCEFTRSIGHFDVYLRKPGN
jgi:hypothetical protein